ncbi:G-protein coupled receptor moody-like isoform X2 [Atheta coriaria]|uniref:G-protein coupled receptor moody-like isoform X2 n=1 Tax=Dalotia coriaria TaxID=877792 RepID=UPI0031F43CC6
MEGDDLDNSQFSVLVRYSEGMMTAAGVVTLFIMIIGVIGNLLTAIALLRHSKIRTVAAAFIASLCVSDLLFCCLVLPFAASQFFHGKWIHGDALCSLVPMMRYGSVGVSLISVATISINRYILIAYPNVYPQIYTKTKVALYIAAIWIFSYGLMMPTFLGVWGTFGRDDKLGTCSINRDANGRSPKVALFMFGFAMPCLVIIISYANIYWVVRQSQKRVAQHSSSNLNTRRSEMHITKMVIVIFVAFVVCYLPLTIVKIFDPQLRFPAIHITAYLLLYTACCINPVIYVTMNKQYRDAYWATLRCTSRSYRFDSKSPDNVQNSKSFMSVSYLKNMVAKNPKG